MSEVDSNDVDFAVSRPIFSFFLVSLPLFPLIIALHSRWFIAIINQQSGDKDQMLLAYALANKKSYCTRRRP
jgi:hypothetical protein